jgi:hypothetical protein
MDRTPPTAARRLTPCIVGLLMMAGSAIAQTSIAADAGQAFDNALQAYEHNHWQTAYAGFAALADSGHAESARIALQMRRHGPALYLCEFDASAQQLAHWSRLRMAAADEMRLRSPAPD